MPFKSKEQERYLQINEPEIYQDWVEKYGRFKAAESFSAEDLWKCWKCGDDYPVSQPPTKIVNDPKDPHGSKGITGAFCSNCSPIPSPSVSLEDLMMAEDETTEQMALRAVNIVHLLKREYSIEDKHITGLYDILFDIARENRVDLSAESFAAEAIPIRHSRRLNGYYGIKGYEDASEDGFTYRIYRAPGTNDWFRAMVYDDNSLRDNFAKPTSRRLNPSGKMTISNDPASLLIGAFPKLEDAKRALVFRMIQDGNYHQMITDGNLKWLLKDYYAESFGAEGDYEPSFDSLEERIEWMRFAVNDKFLHQYEDDYSNVVLDIEEWNENNGNNSKLSNLVKQYKNKTGWMDAESFEALIMPFDRKGRNCPSCNLWRQSFIGGVCSRCANREKGGESFSADNYYSRNYRGFEINKEGDEKQAFYYITKGDNRIEIDFTKSVEGRRKRGDNYNYASYFYGNYPHTAEKMFETFDEALNWFDEQIDNGRMFKDFKAESFNSYKVAPDLSSYTKAELVSSIAGPQGTAAYDEVVYDPVAQSRLSAESIDSFSPARLMILGASIGVALGLYKTRGE